MSTLVGAHRGSWYEHEGVAIKSPYAFLIEGGPSGITGILTIDFRFSCVEKSSIVQCFNNVNHIYAFGHDPERSSYVLTLLLFPRSCGSDMELTRVMSFYDKRKVSVQKDVTITVAGTTYKGIVQSVEVSVYDQQLNILQASLSGQILSKV